MPNADLPALDPRSRLLALLTTALCLLALLLQLPATLATTLGGMAALVMLLSWRRPLHGAWRLLFLVVMLAAVFGVMGHRFGRDTGCALLAAMLAIKPAETASLRDARSLIGFGLFAPFAAFLLDQGPLTMALAALGIISALITLAQLADAEAGLQRQPLPFGQRLALVGRLIAISLPLVLIAFWLFPRFASPMWGVPERALAATGLSDEMTPGQWLDLLADDSPALRAKFFGAVPDPSQMYWRGPVLWDFDGQTWRQPRGQQASAPADFKPGSTRWDYDIELEPTDRRQLLALDLLLQAPDGTRLGRDHGLYAERPLTSVGRWRMQSAPPARFGDELTEAQRQRALALPAARNPRTLALARQWRRELGTDDAAIARRALDMIRGEFGYTLDTPLPGRDGVDEFLFDQKQGFCQHFSSSYVVLMRAAGIPARVVTGYVGGERNPLGDYWVVRQMDAHAWTEVWLPTRGWVRIDPTAAVAPERIYDTIEDRARASAGGLAGLPRVGLVGDWLRRGWNDLVLGFNAERQQSMFSQLGLGKLAPQRLGVLFAISSALALGLMGWWLARGERERDPLLRAWHRLSSRYARMGLEREPHEPALAWAARVRRTHPALAPALESLSQRFTAARYAPDARVSAALLKDLRRHRPSIPASGERS